MFLIAFCKELLRPNTSCFEDKSKIGKRACVNIRSFPCTSNAPRCNANANAQIINEWPTRITATRSKTSWSKCAELSIVYQSSMIRWGQPLAAFTSSDGLCLLELQQRMHSVIIHIRVLQKNPLYTSATIFCSAF